MNPAEMWVHDFATSLGSTPASLFLQGQNALVFATLETLHLFGMVLLIGAVGAFDLRVLGFAKSIPPGSLHRLIPWGIAGFLLNLITGSLLILAHPHDFLPDPALWVKAALLIVAGLNIVAFYGTAFQKLKMTPPGAAAPLRSRIITGISLSAWVGVLICGAVVSSGFFE